MYYNPFFFIIFFLASLPPLLVTAETGGVTREQIEADWLKQAESWHAVVSGDSEQVTTKSDAMGAVDGVKNGRYAFHTSQEKNPYWQVDLEKITPISRIVVYNRLDYAPGLHNADTMRVLISDDAKNWTLLYDCAGKHFGGISGGKPLEIILEQGKAAARYVRLQIPSETPIFFHLDEVEIYSFDDPQNIALWKTANQSSLSQWSVAKKKPNPELNPKYPIKETRARIAKLLEYLKSWNVDVADLETQMHDAAKNISHEEQAEYLRLRRLGRELAFRNPLLNFDKLLFVKVFTQQTYPDICLNHIPWASKPGGDLYVLEQPFATDGVGQKVTPLINGQLGVGHVRGMDLWWDGDRIVFGYAKQENFPFKGWPIPVGEERLSGHTLRLSQEPIHIYEIRTDGTGLRQITNHEMWSDLDPAYLPNGNIVFVSERCGFSLQCNNGPFHDETSCNLFSVKPDGSGMRWLSYNKDGDYQPHVFNDGTIGYCRWEYQERGWANIQAVWSIHPDGTNADAVFKQHLDNPWAFEGTREIPKVPQSEEGDRKFVSVAAGHHTLPCGPVCLLSPNKGINNKDGIRIVTPGVFPPEGGMSGTPVDEGGCRENGGYYTTPFPLSDKFFLASYTYSNEHREGSPPTFRGADETGYGVYLIDVFGNKELIYADPDISSSCAMPLCPRTKPPLLAENKETSLGDKDDNAAVCVITDVTYGADDVKQGEVKYIRVARKIGWPYAKETGGQRYEVDGSSWGLNWAPVLIYGEVPVLADGSTSFYVPSGVSVYFQLLDANKQEIKRMRSFISFQPGESRSCVGCHESRSVPVTNRNALAFKRQPFLPIPPPWGSERCVNYLADVQPVFDRHCVKCHSGLKPSAGLDFSGGLTAAAPMKTPYRSFQFDGLNRSYRTIIENNLITYSYKHASAEEITQTRRFGSSRSKLIDAIRAGACAKYHTLSPESEDWYRLVAWIDANAPYHDRFVNSRPAAPAYDLTADVDLKQTILSVHRKRCAECHQAEDVSRLDWIDLNAPEKSRFLLAPLARNHIEQRENNIERRENKIGQRENNIEQRENKIGQRESNIERRENNTVQKENAGKTCSRAVYSDSNDADYAALQVAVQKAVERAWQFPRRDLETLKENAQAFSDSHELTREQSKGHEGLQGQLGQGEFLEKENRKSAEEFAKSEK
ncbi:MAG: discoidin domain-containing protein [Planctomycetaceae bacterium]|jgi:mono/diheme cytochrome c family protein|nr:discoidin domain-containing protein [Planctomycetaceae bacterium]